MGFCGADSAREELARLTLLKQAGIPVPDLYGRDGSTVYQRFLPQDYAPEILEKIRLSSTPPAKELEDLVRIAARLDRLQFSPLDFVRDLIFDQETGGFFYVDGGSDLGPRGSQPTSRARDSLLRLFPKHRAWILRSYASS